MRPCACFWPIFAVINGNRCRNCSNPSFLSGIIATGALLQAALVGGVRIWAVAKVYSTATMGRITARQHMPSTVARQGRPVGHAVVEVGDVLVQKPDAAGRDRPADRPFLMRAVQAVERVLPILEDIECPRAQRIRLPGGMPPLAIEYGSSSG